MSANSDIRTTFFQECEELLEAMTDGLAEIDAASRGGACDQETLNAVFRAVHSIKGGAGAFGLNELVRFAHAFETTLDALRSGRIQPTPDLSALLFRAGDHLSDLVAASKEERTLPAAESDPLLAALAEASGGKPAEPTPSPVPATPPIAGSGDEFGFVPLGLPLDLSPPAAASYTIRFAPTRQLYANGHDPVNLFEALSELGDPEVTLDVSALPDFTELDWEESYLTWKIALATAQPEKAVREVFEFVEGLAELSIQAVEPEEEAVAEAEAASPPAPEGLPAKEARTTLAKEPEKAATAPVSSTIRVDLDRVERLINAVGELVITQAMLSQRLVDSGLTATSEISAGLDAFRNLTGEIQESVMAIRAQSIKPLFQRMGRIVREAGMATGKAVQFVTEGEATEVDKTVIERLADPLTHILRNAIDHGIETEEKRREAGKEGFGTIRLSAAHRSGRVVIEVADDGAGINRERVRAIAVERGLIDPALELSESEIDKLLFLPGFSTRSQVSDLSGRGVGMDVVKRSIQSLGGRVSIQSTPGQGTVISISLPLTLAVLDGMVVEVCDQTMVVPLTAVVETLRPANEDLHAIGPDSEVVSVRDSIVPVIDLGRVFGFRPEGYPKEKVILLLVETDERSRYALAVDVIRDQRQVVIKGLEANYGHVPGIAAATILGNGQIALIIDPEDTVSQSRRTGAPAL
ncbi:chemotaxis protein CheA [Solirhodobacter olei]|uniref:chemotaxis protein CheA n=1 Tax=Solirhodobacter olei TaxID=2493082 RepID=UPI000FD912C7|nr:chemotaxis protein CheA [Solirhodobacter olei]